MPVCEPGRVGWDLAVGSVHASMPTSPRVSPQRGREDVRLKSQRFSGQIIESKKGAAIEVPFNPNKVWGTRARTMFPRRRGHTVLASIAGGPQFKSFIIEQMRLHWLLIAPAQLHELDAGVGYSVTVELQPVFVSPDPHGGEY